MNTPQCTAFRTVLSFSVRISICGMILIFCIPAAVLFAQFQNPRATARSGNEAYGNGRYKEAEEKYREALKQDNTLREGVFNLGTALYKQKKYEEAADQFRLLADNAKASKEIRAKSYHNLGNTFFRSQKLQESVDAYKSALRCNPDDDDTRYNLAHTQKLLLQQQQQQNKQQNQDNKDNSDRDKEQQQQQNQQQQQQNQQQQQQQNKQQQTQPKLSKADAERILDALNNEERNIQKRLVKRKATGVVVEKDW